MTIKFSAELIHAWAIYMGKSRLEFYKDLPYTRQYITRVVIGEKPVSESLNMELNKKWNNAGMTFDDLEMVYGIADQINDTNKNIKNLRRKKK